MTSGVQEKGSKALSLKLLTPTDVENLPDLEYLIGGILPAPTFGVLYGPPGSGKSFVALSMALAVASGDDWLGRPTTQGKVLYIAAEGVLGMKLRIQAYRQKFDIDDGEVRFIAEPFNIRESKQVDLFITSLMEVGFQPDLIVIDTLARVAVGVEENSAKEMGEVIDGFDRIKRETGACTLVIHHSTKDGGHERGSSALRGAADVMILCENPSDESIQSVNLTCDKMKDDEPFAQFSVTLEKVTLPDGKSSLVATNSTGPIPNKTKAKAQSKHRNTIMEIMVNDFKNDGATYTELHKAFVAKGAGSKSTFDREWKTLKVSQDVIEKERSGDAVFVTADPGKFAHVSKEDIDEMRQFLSDIKKPVN
ncbi:MAG: helicase RepA family protein [Sulfitobacter sp.]